MRPSILLAILLLAGCDRGPVPATSGPVVPLPIAPAAEPVASAVAIDDKTDLLDFHLSWPAEVTAIPALAEMIRAPALAHKVELLDTAASDRAQRAKEDFPFHGYEFSESYEVAGDTPRLLSLAADWSEYTGGAHPMHGTKALLWDRVAGQRIAFPDLLEGGLASLDTLLKPQFCKALDQARAQKRGPDAAPAVGADDPFNSCPAFGELVLIPQGRPAGALTTIRIHADPYVAGPYAEGDYDVVLPVSPAFMAALKPAFRASFQPQRQ